jgi:hypothetical protein
MFSTPKSKRGVHANTAALALAAAVGLAGCTTAPEPKPEEQSTAPLVIDEAMQRRGDWPRVAAVFQAGGVDAGITRFPYQPQTEGPDAGQAIFGNERANALFDPFFFTAQAIALPFTYIFDPPFTKKNHRGVVYDSTYTAMPLMPPDQEPEGGGLSPGQPREVRPEPRETAPVTPDAAEASELPPGETPPEEAPLDIQPEEMPGEEATPEAGGEAGPGEGGGPLFPDDPPAPDEAAPDADPAATEPTVTDSDPAATEPAVTDPDAAATEPTVTDSEPAPMPESTDPAATEPLPEPIPEPEPTTEPEPATEPAAEPDAASPAPDDASVTPDAEVPAPDAAAPAPDEPAPEPAPDAAEEDNK